MALLFCDSFDDRPAASIGDRYASGGVSHEPVPGRTGKAALISTGILDQNEHLTWQSNTTHQTLYVGVATNVNLSTALCSIRLSGTPHIYVQLNSDRTLSVVRYGTPSVTILATSTRTVPADEWFYVELMGKIDPTSGAYELRVDGARWLSASGVNTSSTGDSLANQVRLTYNHPAVDDYTRMVDDFYISDDDPDDGNASIVGFAGPVKIAHLTQTGDGGVNEWTPLYGSHYEQIDENGKDSDTTYVHSATDGATDTFTLSDLETPLVTIKAVAVHQWARKEDALYRGIIPTVRVSSTNYEGDEMALTGSYARAFHAFERNPATNAAWTLTEVNAVQVGATASTEEP